MPPKLNIAKGFQLEEPAVFVQWSITETQLSALIGKRLHKVTTGYFTMECVSLGGMKHLLGFHFAPGGPDCQLKELEFFRNSYADQKGSFDDFQKRFEAVFGPPTSSIPGNEGFPSYKWKLNGATIVHYVREHFGPEEHMRIQKEKGDTALSSVIACLEKLIGRSGAKA